MNDEKMTQDVSPDNAAEETTDKAEQTVDPASEQAEQIDWQQEAERWRAQAEENNNRLLRAMADMENMRRRLRKEQEDLAKYASQKVVEELLPVLDNFERALSADKEAMTVESLLTGVDMVYRQMVQVFEKEGLAPIPAKGQPFDPHVHQAVMQTEDPEYGSGVVVEELQKGYQFKDRVIRPAMVKVNA
ncbi:MULTISPECIES: nucleotide exchange factor GrpE [Brevibacillus]|uniref:Protein GrpE n=1 Tax=Brevibacillus borstelensis AK1 TaxID=1300222 RepID=M8DUU4_9BACL|nr:nucleotide exchange factor GrpE [Brevibacillus borstelensis]EMT50761.1 GrpE protein [Brevibacillus borstelensis AK1]KKX55923.1 molecular chaperone GrpE [Brevibacillus borstelensis cifa_chp40]MCC0564484.1 nucleotide exchange factor GrpE [Brevibacillus borstelensis]MCM3471162.1 nucleotide exchange factor GrpE [Brevibacillus borstelensis]MCM3559636.1 nucleotide exchange factor GrpE [Brevibacillus borstelensis]